jgi:hypothetical protein
MTNEPLMAALARDWARQPSQSALPHAPLREPARSRRARSRRRTPHVPILPPGYAPAHLDERPAEAS